MSELVTRLILETGMFDSNLKKSTKQIRSFQDMGKSVAGTVTKFAGALGIAYSATEVLQKGLNANATLQGKYNDLMKTGSTVTDQFFNSLYSGDWTVFNDGILSAIKNAKDYIEAYRKIQRTLEATSVRYEQTDAKKNQLEAIIEDENRSKEERKKAQEELDRLLIMGIADIRDASMKTEKTLIKGLSSIGYNGNVKNAQSLILDLYDSNSTKSVKAEEYRRLRDAMEQSRKTYNSNPNSSFAASYYQSAKDNFLSKGYTEEEKKIYDSYIRIIDSLTDEKYRELSELFDKVNDLNDKAGTWEKDRAGARDEIAGIKEGVKASATKGIKAAAKETEKEFKTEPLSVSMRLVQENDLEYGRNKRVQQDIQSGYIQVQGAPSEAIESNINYMDSLNGIATIMGSITNITNEGAAGWIQYSSNVISSVAAMLPVLANLFNIEAALGMAKQAKLAFPMNIIAMAATTAGLVAAIASVPKFATGGIVPGTSYTGDKVPAMVNSGEMILNGTQQANLFKMLNGGGGRASNIHITGRLVAHGRDLVAAIDNQNNFNNRVR